MSEKKPPPAIIAWDQAFNRNGDRRLERAVGNAIRTYMDNHTLTGHVSAETLAADTGMQERGVRKQIAALVAAGWLEIVVAGHSKRANLYRLLNPVLQDTVNPVRQDTLNPVPADTVEPCPPAHRTLSASALHPVLQDTPTTTSTSPSTSPKEKYEERATTMYQDPWRGQPEPECPGWPADGLGPERPDPWANAAAAAAAS